MKQALKQFWKGLRKGMHLFSSHITVIVNSVLLSIVYIIGVGLTALIAKITGRRTLETRLKGKTYWSKLDLKKQPIEEHYRQF